MDRGVRRSGLAQNDGSVIGIKGVLTLSARFDFGAGMDRDDREKKYGNTMKHH